MPKLTDAKGQPKRLTDTIAKQLPGPPAPPPEKGGTEAEFYWCGTTPGFGVRVTHRGARSWIFERRVDGKTKRRTLGAVTGRGAISGDDARKQAIIISGELQQGTDRLQVKRAKAKADKDDVTLGEAVAAYVEQKRVKKKPLKARTKADYLGMLRPPGVGAVRLRADGTTARKDSGKVLVEGELFPLADRPLSTITGDDMRKLHAGLKKAPEKGGRGERRATYAMQVLRAVLNWHAVKVPDNPLDDITKGSKRIVLPATAGKPNPIPRESLGAWWRAAGRAGSDGEPGWRMSADFAQFVLLTGIRAGEGVGNDYELGIHVRDVNLRNTTVTLPDTKNRGDHTVYLSTQALEIVARNVAGKKKGDKLFPVRSISKTLHSICAAAGTEYRSPHKLRKTFASIAQKLVSVYCLKAMLNHASGGDVTDEFYVLVEEHELRAGWQAVGDFIEQLANQQEPEVWTPSQFLMRDGQVVRRAANG